MQELVKNRVFPSKKGSKRSPGLDEGGCGLTPGSNRIGGVCGEADFPSQAESHTYWLRRSTVQEGDGGRWYRTLMCWLRAPSWEKLWSATCYVTSRGSRHLPVPQHPPHPRGNHLYPQGLVSNDELLSTKCFVQCLERSKSQITEVAVVTAMMMVTIATLVEQVKRCWVPEGSGEHLSVSRGIRWMEKNLLPKRRNQWWRGISTASLDYNSAWHQVAPGGSHSSLAGDDGT